mgnify:CR=1 FL=1
MSDTNIISITDIIEQKVRKQRELDDYEVRVEEWKRKRDWVEKEIQMAEFIIAAVQHEISPQQFIKALIEAELEKKDWKKLDTSLQIVLY